MLVARTANNEWLNLLDVQLTKDELQHKRKKEKFYCPACKQEVVLKLGTIQAWHFAHKQKCTIRQEAESAYHINGKKLLYKWLRAQNYEVEVEKYLPDIKQRPDIMFNVNGKNFVIEFQCSPIPLQLLQKRTAMYRKLQLIPLWILGGSHYKAITDHVYEFTRFHWYFTYERNARPQLFYFCPQRHGFTVLQNIISVSATKVIATSSFLPLRKISFTQLLLNYKEKLLTHPWQNQKQYWRSYRIRLSQAEKYMQKQLYLNGAPLSLFPSEAGIPVKYHHYIEAPLYIWQSWIFNMIHKQYNVGDKFPLAIIHAAFRTMIEKNIFVIRLLPFQHVGGEYKAVEQYLLLLCQLGLLEKDKDQTFLLKKMLKYPINMEAAIQNDKLIAQKIYF